MQCQCGGDARASTKVKASLKAELRFYLCVECGRVSDGVLTINNLEVETDRQGLPLARVAFNTLTRDSAASLLQKVVPQQAPAQQTLF